MTASKNYITAGRITSYVSNKKFGFIQGDDGEQYFFHTSFLQDKTAETLLLKGARVEFDPTPSPKGLTAKSVVVFNPIVGRKIRPFIRSRNAQAKDGTIERELHLRTRFFKDPNEGRQYLERLAHRVGANALLSHHFLKETFTEGNYQYSMHTFLADIAVITEKVTFNSERERDNAQNNVEHHLALFDEHASSIKELEEKARIDMLKGDSLSIVFAGVLTFAAVILYFIANH
jgi:cold shock CspA family protein